VDNKNGIGTGSAASVQEHLACTQCKGSLSPQGSGFVCTRCRRAFEVRDGVFMARAPGEGHYFDNRHEVMQQGNASPETWAAFYSQQSELASTMIAAGEVVVDVGCGPSTHFDKPSGAVLIGIDPSFESVRANRGVDIRVFGGGEAMPLADKSVDRIFFFYSVHHMVGTTVADNAANLSAVLDEASRVVRKNGSVVIFDLNPWWPAWTAQRLAWNRARSTLASKLDMFFWRESSLTGFAERAFPGARRETRTFRVSPFAVFPPVFSLPSLKIPRFLYPFDLKMYKWSF
jgi:SAM-dependent methyltransferase